MSESTKSEQLLYDKQRIEINREALFPGSGMLNTLIHIISKCYFTSNGKSFYNAVIFNEETKTFKKTEFKPVVGEYQCDYKALNFFIERCNGSEKNKPLLESLTLLKENKLIEIKYINADESSKKDIKNIYIRIKLSDYLKDCCFAKNVKHNPNMAASTNKGYFFLPRNLSELLPKDYEFTYTDALWDIITSTCYKDSDYPYSLDKAFVVFRDNESPMEHYTYRDLMSRWNWSSTSKVDSFFKKYKDFLEINAETKHTQIFISNKLLYSGLFWRITENVEKIKVNNPYGRKGKNKEIIVNTIEKLILCGEKKLFKYTKITRRDLLTNMRYLDGVFASNDTTKENKNLNDKVINDNPVYEHSVNDDFKKNKKAEKNNANKTTINNSDQMTEEEKAVANEQTYLEYIETKSTNDLYI